MDANNSYQVEKKYYETQASEEAFLEWYKKQSRPTYDTPSVTVDMVLFCYNREQDELKILLIKRNSHPFKDSWALPGGFVRRDEATADSCIRETFEETNVRITHQNIEQLHTFSRPDRDPRGWVITVSYLAFIGEEPVKAGDDAKDALWFSLNRSGDTLVLSDNAQKDIMIDLPSGKNLGTEKLAFDHAEIIVKAFNRIANKMYHEPQVLRVLGEEFTITEARKVYAKFLGIDYREIDHSNFKKALLDYFVEVSERATGVGRPSKIYRLKNED